MWMETLLLIQAGLTAMMIKLGHIPEFNAELSGILLNLVLIVLTFQVCLYVLDVYEMSLTIVLTEFARRFGLAMLLASILLWSLQFLFPQIGVARGVFLINFILSASVLTAWHMLLRFYLAEAKPRSNVIVIGTGPIARSLVREVLRRPELGIKIHGFVDDKPDLLGVALLKAKVIGLHEDLAEIIAERRIDRVVVELQDRRGRLPANELLFLKTRGIKIEDAISFYERVTGKIEINHLNPSWLLFNPGLDVPKHRLVCKRSAEFILSLLLLALFSPVLLITAVLIKLDSAGPVFYRQERTGKNGRTFILCKFRSMFQDAESATGPVWAGENDSRITRVGRILRRTRIDELPQLFNVLRGEMSFIGPRPERPCFVRSLASHIPYYDLRHIVKPGITGWAQVNNGYANSVEDTTEKLRYDLFYIKNLSFRLDALITLDTVKTCLWLRGV
jgi:sugar transferase (PEP-CTERM system associated)